MYLYHYFDKLIGTFKNLSGLFTEKNGQTEIDLTEDVVPKKWIMKPFIRGFLKKQQELYVADLKKALQN